MEPRMSYIYDIGSEIRKPKINTDENDVNQGSNWGGGQWPKGGPIFGVK